MTEPKHQPKSEQSIQEEIKKEDRSFLTGGILFLVALGLLLLVGGFLLIRFLLIPVFKSILGTFQAPTQPVASPKDATPEPILKDIDAVPYTWNRTELDNVGISIESPPEATISSADNTATVELGGTNIVFTNKSMTADELEDEVNNLRLQRERNDGNVSLVKETTIAAMNGYTFTVGEPPQTRYIYLPKTDSAYLEIALPVIKEDDEKYPIIEDVLASIEVINDESLIEPESKNRE